MGKTDKKGKKYQKEGKSRETAVTGREVKRAREGRGVTGSWGEVSRLHPTASKKVKRPRETTMWESAANLFTVLCY